MYLPQLKYAEAATKKQIIQFRGINLSDNTQEGEFSACTNLSSRRYPYLSQRMSRIAVGDYVDPTAIFSWGKMLVIDGTSLIYDGDVVGTVTAGSKQFAAVNTKLVIWPDKKYLDLSGSAPELKPIGAIKAATAGTVSFATNTLTISGTPALTSLFKAGDDVTVSGCTKYPANNKDVVIKSITDSIITVADSTFTAGSETAAVTIERKVPDLDYICESQNRLWGCSNADKTIYASALGDPTNFFVYEGDSTDSYAVAIGSDGDFSGCRKLSTSVLFWKENILHKVLGSYPAEYQIYEDSITGLQAGSSKSMQVINDVLFYKGIAGVYAYSGGTPSLISENFDARRFDGAVAGTDGVRYYISMREGTEWSLFVYDTQKSMWLREDDTQAVDFCRLDGNMYILSADGSVWAEDAGTGTEVIEWSAQFTPFTETIQGRKSYSRIYIRMEMEKTARMKAEVRCDGRTWVEAGKASGDKQLTTTMIIQPMRCDKFEVRLSGKGNCAIQSVVREFRVGSEV